MTSTWAIHGWIPAADPSQLLWVSPLGILWVYPCASQLGWVDPWASPGLVHFCTKKHFWTQHVVCLGISWDFCHVLKNYVIFLEFLGDFWRLGTDTGENIRETLEKKGCEVDFGRRGNTSCHRIDKLFKPNWPPDSPPDPSRPPDRPPGGFEKQNHFFQKKEFALPSC